MTLQKLANGSYEMAVRGRDARMPRDGYVNGRQISSNKPAFSLIMVSEGGGKAQTYAHFSLRLPSSLNYQDQRDSAWRS
jgi:hypothetical protein